jgi:putative membrane-bound dehydrogenase-like protein
MQTKYLLATATSVGGFLFFVVSVPHAASQSDVRRLATEQPAEAGRKGVDSANFRIHAGWQPLFNGRNLDGWYTFLQQHGRNADPDHIVTIDDGVIHLYRDTANGSRVVKGYIATKKQYGNYHLRLQYRWGEKKFEPRAAMPRDAGLYYHMAGDDAVWPAGLQYQIQQGNTGDLLALFGLQADSWIDPATRDLKTRTFRDSKLGGLPVVFGGSGISYQTRSVMNELAGWNNLEVIARGSSVTHVLNGKTVNRCENARKIDAAVPTHSSPVTQGKIALEIEAAEIQYRNIEIKQLEPEQPVDERTERTLSKGESDLRVGASAVNLRSDKTMVIAGGIEPHYAAEQEGELRAVAVVIERPGQTKLAIVACDVLFVPRDLADAAVAEIERKTGITPNHVLINATHTHHAPSIAAVHGYGVEPKFREELRRGIVRAVEEANGRLKGGEAKLFFHLGNEDTVGSNSRQLLEDGSITWMGQQEPGEKARPTAPFDPQLPVIDFRDPTGKSRALLFNHSTHTIGTRSGRDARSPSFYGLAAQELERELGGVVGFVEGASGSTHNVAPKVPVPECIQRLKSEIRDARSKALPRQVANLAGIRRPFKFHIRRFDDAKEDAKIAQYLTKYAPQASNRFREVFANMRRKLRDRQGAEQETWIQAITIGDVAIVGVPAEYFTVLGVDIKRRSPFEFTYVAELANDWIGYLPDREGHRLGGYQTWMGLHSYAEEGTGERMADEVVQMLDELAANANAKNKAAPKSVDDKPNAKAAEAANSPGAKSPDAERASFKLADRNLQIELVVSEPDVASPVAIAWDADGRMYVAEMGGYPATKKLGRIRRLEDSDGDGKYEHAVTFCDELNFPTSVMPYRDGLLVADAPDILYLKDTDGDGRADLRRVEWTGFGTGSQQLRANALHWGLDNWIYVANGRCDGDVRRPDASPEQAISIRARDFRFHPIRGTAEAILGQSQFGQAHDAWGNRFLSWNTIPVRHVVLEESEVRNFSAAATEAVVNVSDPSDTGRVYPISARPRQFNTEPAQYYNAMCGLTIFTGDALGKSYTGNAFIGESLSNLVTRRRLQSAGPTFVSSRGGDETNREFLASTDNWFHPVSLATGPDGALYIVDFYREFVEHPLYVADQRLRAEVPWRNGAEHGRIWRIRRTDFSSPPGERRPQLSRAPSAELVKQLSHSISWWRNTAQRLLVERQDQTVVSQLRTLLTNSQSPLARLHALYTLDGLDANGAARQVSDRSADDDSRSLDNTSLRRALGDREPNIRRHAIRMAAAADRSSFADDLLQMASDSDSGVRFQLALAIGRYKDPRAYHTLATLLDREDTPLLRSAILCGIGKSHWPLMRELMEDDARAKRNAIFLEQVGEQFGSQGGEKELAECFDWITADSARSRSAGGLAMLAGLSRGLFARGNSLRESNLPVKLPSKHVTEGLREIVQTAETIAKDANRSLDDRIRAVVIAANGKSADVERLVLELVRPSQPQPVQSAGVRAAAQANSPSAWKSLFRQWVSHTASTREVMIAESLRSSAGIDALVSALEADILSAQELPASTRQVLGQTHNESLRRRAQPLLVSVIPADRTEVLKRYADVARRSGDPARGASLFKQNCQTCHAIQGVGHKVGPDLASVASRRTDLLIVDILDPSRQVSPDFINYLMVTKDGRVLNGVIAGETTVSVTLRREEGQQDTIPRSDIEELRATGKSIMPDGLEVKLTPDQLADLLEFLHHPDINQLN